MRALHEGIERRPFLNKREGVRGQETQAAVLERVPVVVLVRRKVRALWSRGSRHRHVVMAVVRPSRAGWRTGRFEPIRSVRRVGRGTGYEGPACWQDQTRHRRANRQCNDRQEGQPSASAKAATNGAHGPTLDQRTGGTAARPPSNDANRSSPCRFHRCVGGLSQGENIFSMHRSTRLHRLALRSPV